MSFSGFISHKNKTIVHNKEHKQCSNNEPIERRGFPTCPLPKLKLLFVIQSR